VREDAVMDLAAAIRSMTSLPASVFGMSDRGVIREGAVADLVVFDPDELTDNATYRDPHQFSEGVEYVFLGGRMAVERGEFNTELYGKVLTRN
jgi:N-acyl-D-aspartate/D-glutamate deacylase